MSTLVEVGVEEKVEAVQGWREKSQALIAEARVKTSQLMENFWQQARVTIDFITDKLAELSPENKLRICGALAELAQMCGFETTFQVGDKELDITQLEAYDFTSQLQLRFKPSSDAGRANSSSVDLDFNSTQFFLKILSKSALSISKDIKVTDGLKIGVDHGVITASFQAGA